MLSALLYLDAKYVKTNRLLAEPFVSDLDARYPPMYLDGDFLTSELLYPLSAAEHIRGHLDTIPPALLEQLAHSLIKALDAVDSDRAMYNALHAVAINVVIRLAESDRPSLATRLAIRTVLDRPKSSSWHRQLLKKGFLLRLSASEARSCIDTFANEIMHMIESRERLAEDPTSQRDKPHVKVTTIKLLIQLLQEPQYFGVEYALSILSALSATNCHIDVRLLIVKTLLSLPMLDSPEYWDQKLTLLEHVVPLAGALDERAPMDESKWMQSEQNLSLPEPPKQFRGQFDTERPILATLVGHFLRERNKIGRVQLFDRIMLPVFQSLKDQTARWTRLFLRKHRDTQGEQEEIIVPCVPIIKYSHLSLLLASGNRFCCIPCASLEEYVAYMHFNISPPKSVRELNERLRADKALSSQAEVRTWLRLYGRGINVVPYDFISLLDYAEDSADDTAITPRLIQEEFLKLFTAVLWTDTPAYMRLTGVASKILSPESITKSWWAASGKPVVEAMIAYVDSLRTREWERDPNRAPFILPDTFPWRLRTLDYPLPSQEDADIDGERKSKAFAKQLSVMVDEMSGLGVYHHHLDHLRTYLNLDFALSAHFQATQNVAGPPLNAHDMLRNALANNRILVAIYLGDLSNMRLSWVTSPELLRCEVAAILVKKVGYDINAEKKMVREDVRQRLVAMLAEWKGCENEELRRRGGQLENEYLG